MDHDDGDYAIEYVHVLDLIFTLCHAHKKSLNSLSVMFFHFLAFFNFPISSWLSTTQVQSPECMIVYSASIEHKEREEKTDKTNLVLSSVPIMHHKDFFAPNRPGHR